MFFNAISSLTQLLTGPDDDAPARSASTSAVTGPAAAAAGTAAHQASRPASAGSSIGVSVDGSLRSGAPTATSTAITRPSSAGAALATPASAALSASASTAAMVTMTSTAINVSNPVPISIHPTTDAVAVTSSSTSAAAAVDPDHLQQHASQTQSAQQGQVDESDEELYRVLNNAPRIGRSFTVASARPAGPASSSSASASAISVASAAGPVAVPGPSPIAGPSMLKSQLSPRRVSHRGSAVGLFNTPAGSVRVLTPKSLSISGSTGTIAAAVTPTHAGPMPLTGSGSATSMVMLSGTPRRASAQLPVLPALDDSAPRRSSSITSSSTGSAPPSPRGLTGRSGVVDGPMPLPRPHLHIQTPTSASGAAASSSSTSTGAVPLSPRARLQHQQHAQMMQDARSVSSSTVPHTPSKRNDDDAKSTSAAERTVASSLAMLTQSPLADTSTGSFTPAGAVSGHGHTDRVTVHARLTSLVDVDLNSPSVHNNGAGAQTATGPINQQRIADNHSASISVTHVLPVTAPAINRIANVASDQAQRAATVVSTLDEIEANLTPVGSSSRPAVSFDNPPLHQAAAVLPLKNTAAPARMSVIITEADAARPSGDVSSVADLPMAQSLTEKREQRTNDAVPYASAAVDGPEARAMLAQIAALQKSLSDALNDRDQAKGEAKVLSCFGYDDGPTG